MAASTNIYGWNIGGNNNSFDQRGHFYRAFLDGNVSGMAVKQNSTPNMTVLVEHGSALLNKNTTSASIAEIKADTPVTIDTANTANPRIDSIVIYEDISVTIPTVEASYWQDGAGGRFKIVSLPGTAAASPVALSNSSIQSAIGAGKPWTRLANITVPANSTTIINSNITDTRSPLSSILANGSVTYEKLSTPVAFAVTTSSTSIPVSTFTKILFTVESYDDGNNQTGSTFTVPANGIYQFNAAVVVGGTGSGNWGVMAIYVNGSTFARGGRTTLGSTFDMQLQVSSSLKLNAGDTVEVYAFQSSASTKSLTGTASENYFNGFRIR